MYSITISGKEVLCHFGMHFTQAFPKALVDLQPVTDIDFATEAIWAAHVNHCKAYGGALQLKKYEVFQWVEASYQDPELAKVLSGFIDSYNQSDFGKAVNEANKELAKEIADDAKKKPVGKKSKVLHSE